MKHSPQLATWLGLGATFLGLLTTLFSVWATRRQKAASNAEQPESPQARQGLGRSAQLLMEKIFSPYTNIFLHRTTHNMLELQ